MHLLTSQQARDLDALTIKKGTPSSVLMENAGRGVFKFIRKHFKQIKNKKFVVVCGPGNNGGDGFVVARYLARSHAQVNVFIMGHPQKLKGDSLENFIKLKKTRVQIQLLSPKLLSQSIQTDCLVDAVFGTGLSRNISGFPQKLIEWMNAQEAFKISIDIPSGLDANTGMALGSAFKAHHTVTFGFPKCGFFMQEASSYVGHLNIVDIGLLDFSHHPLQLITKKDIQNLLKQRKALTHKGTYGHAMTIACSENKMGAGLMSSHAALRAGAGLSTLILPAAAFGHIDTNKPEIMFEPIGAPTQKAFKKSDVPIVLKKIKQASVVALGPGLGMAPSTIGFVWQLVSQIKQPLIIDADGLNAVSKNPRILLRRKNKTTVLTPHPAEMGRLIGKTTAFVQKNRRTVARQLAQKFGAIVLLKGFRSLVAFPNGNIWVNPTGNASMAVAGQGDVLCGLYAGLVSEFGPCDEVFLLGCFLHGLVGDLLAKKGARVVRPTDIIQNLHLGWRFLKKRSPVLETEFY